MSPGCDEGVPAKLASSPKIRSSSSACPDGLVDLQRHLCGADDHVGLTGRRLRRGEQRDRLFADPGGLLTRSRSRTYSQPPAAVLPWNEFG